MYFQSQSNTQRNIEPSDTSFHMKSVRFYCTPCNRQFSFLNPENGRAVCPRCENVSTRRVEEEARSQTRNSTQSQTRPQQARQQQAQPQRQRQRQTGPFGQFFMDPGMFGNGQVFMNPMSTGMFFAEPDYEQEYPQRYISNDIGSLLSNMFGMNQVSNGYAREFNQTNYDPNQFPFEFFGGMQQQPSQQMYRVGDRLVTAEEYERLVQEFIESDPNDHGPAPATEESLRKLKSFAFDAGIHKAVDCSVCQENYMKGENCVELPCEHTFHKDCVVEWLKRHDTCPVCRKPTDPNKMVEEPQYY